MHNNSIIENYINIKKTIEAQAKEWYNPIPTLLAVSKHHQPENIIPLLEHGHRSFGENIIQEAIKKWSPLKDKYSNIKLHLIGHLQRNKVKEALQIFDVIETLDSEKLALEIKKHISPGNNQKLYIQVNIGKETQKYGINPEETSSFTNFCKNDLQLNITGLMCIPPKDCNPSPYFAYLKTLAKKANIKYLSQGMSNDFTHAIAVGTNEIRIGTAIFGERNKINAL